MIGLSFPVKIGHRVLAMFMVQVGAVGFSQHRLAKEANKHICLKKTPKIEAKTKYDMLTLFPKH